MINDGRNSLGGAIVVKEWIEIITKKSSRLSSSEGAALILSVFSP